MADINVAEKKRWVVRFSGHVQGVGFRMTALAQARGMAIHGFVRNEPDGSVLMDVEGSESDLSELVRRIHRAMEGNIEDALRDERPLLNRAEGFRIQH